MKKLLQKISWKTRKIRLTITFLKIYLHDQQETWGFNLLGINHDLREYSLLRFEFRLPNRTNIRRFTVDSWDFLYLSRPLWDEYDNLSDHYLWSMNDPEGWDKIKLNILGKLFR